MPSSIDASLYSNPTGGGEVVHSLTGEREAMITDNQIPASPNVPLPARKVPMSYEDSIRWRKAESRFWIAATFAFFALYILSEIQVGPLKNADLVNKKIAVQGVLVCIFLPVVFRLIFDRLPLAFMHEAWKTIKGSYVTFSFPTYLPESINSTTSFSIGEHEENRPNTDWSNLAETSRNLASRIYQRSGVYLLAGVAIAFSGLSFFYFAKPASTLAEAVEISVWLRESVPRFGMLVFIELIAFFFLRLYRNSMDEFRHFETITRHREEVAALLRLHKDGEIGLDIGEMLKNRDFFSEPRKLNSDQTTEILESRKLERNELAILEKAIDAVGNSRK